MAVTPALTRRRCRSDSSPIPTSVPGPRRSSKPPARRRSLGKRGPVEAEEERLRRQLRIVGTPLASRWRQKRGQPLRRRRLVVGLDRAAEEASRPRQARRRRRTTPAPPARSRTSSSRKTMRPSSILASGGVERATLVARRLEHIARPKRTGRLAHDLLGVSPRRPFSTTSVPAIARRQAALGQGRRACEREGLPARAWRGRRRFALTVEGATQLLGDRTACGDVRTSSNRPSAARNSSTAFLHPP